MNSHKSDAQHISFERSLGLMLRNWALKYSPTPGERARLLHRAFYVQQENLFFKHSSRNIREMEDKIIRGPLVQARRLDNIWKFHDPYELTACRII